MNHIEQILAHSLYGSNEFSREAIEALNEMVDGGIDVVQVGIVANPHISALTYSVLFDYLKRKGRNISSSEYNQFITRVDPQRMNDLICNVYLGLMHGLTYTQVDIYAQATVENFKIARILTEKLKDFKDDSLYALLDSRILSCKGYSKILLQDFLNDDIPYDAIYLASPYKDMTEEIYSFFRNADQRDLAIFRDACDVLCKWKDYETILNGAEVSAIRVIKRVTDNDEWLDCFNFLYRSIPEGTKIESAKVWKSLLNKIGASLRSKGNLAEAYIAFVRKNPIIDKALLATISQSDFDFDNYLTNLLVGSGTSIAQYLEDKANAARQRFVNKYRNVFVTEITQIELLDFLMANEADFIHALDYVSVIPLDNANVYKACKRWVRNFSPFVAIIFATKYPDLPPKTVKAYKVLSDVDENTLVKYASHVKDPITFINFATKVHKEEPKIDKVFEVYNSMAQNPTQAFEEACSSENVDEPITHDVYIIFDEQRIFDNREDTLLQDLDIISAADFIEEDIVDDLDSSDDFQVMDDGSHGYYVDALNLPLDNKHVLVFTNLGDGVYDYVFEIKRQDDDFYYSKKVKTKDDVIKAIQRSISLIDRVPAYQSYVEELKHILEGYR